MTDKFQSPEYRTTICKCLSRSRRRYTLYRLRETETPLALPEVAEEIADWEAESPRSDRSDDAIKDIQTALHHVHLPMLAEADLVQYDLEQKEVALSDCPKELFDGDQHLPTL